MSRNVLLLIGCTAVAVGYTVAIYLILGLIRSKRKKKQRDLYLAKHTAGCGDPLEIKLTDVQARALRRVLDHAISTHVSGSPDIRPLSQIRDRVDIEIMARDLGVNPYE